MRGWAGLGRAGPWPVITCSGNQMNRAVEVRSDLIKMIVILHEHGSPDEESRGGKTTGT